MPSPTAARGPGQPGRCDLRSYTVDGRDVIGGFAVDERAEDGRGQVLAPWPNHGLVRRLDWSLVAYDATSVKLSCSVRSQSGYEWQLELIVSYALGDPGLTVTLQAVNVDMQRARFGVGFHPYLTLGTNSVDGLMLTVPASRFLDPAGTKLIGPSAAGRSWRSNR